MFFKNRSVVMKMVEDKQMALEPAEPVDYSAISQELVKSLGTLIVVYVTADTIRQSLLLVLKTKV